MVSEIIPTLCLPGHAKVRKRSVIAGIAATASWSRQLISSISSSARLKELPLYMCQPVNHSAK
jgi:hypothetical protein